MATNALEQITVGWIELQLERPEDPEALIDEAAFAIDEFLPYWAEQWASGIALAEHVVAEPLQVDSTRAPARVLELGCGLGLPSLVAARLGAKVVATDWSSDAIALLERNAARNGVRVTALAADWRDLDAFASLGTFDVVLAADVLYEERNVEPILMLLERVGSAALVADPGRRHAAGFLEGTRQLGWRVETHAHGGLPNGGIHHVSPPRGRQATRTAIPG